MFKQYQNMISMSKHLQKKGFKLRTYLYYKCESLSVSGLFVAQ